MTGSSWLAIMSMPTVASLLPVPLALVNAQSVMIPVSGSTAMWALNPSWRRCTVL